MQPAPFFPRAGGPWSAWAWTRPTKPTLPGGFDVGAFDRMFGFKPTNKNAKSAIGGLLAGMLLPGAMQGLADWQKQYEPLRRSALNRGIAALDPSNSQAMVDRFRRQSEQQAIRDAMQTQAAMADMGMGSGSQQGALLQGLNNSQVAANAMQSNMASPEFLSAAIRAQLGLIDQAAADPRMAALMQLVAGAPYHQSQPKNDIFGQVLGGALGTGLGSVLGKLKL